jgi:hypothetical protein
MKLRQPQTLNLKPWTLPVLPVPIRRIPVCPHLLLAFMTLFPALRTYFRVGACAHRRNTTWRVLWEESYVGYAICPDDLLSQ